MNEGKKLAPPPCADFSIQRGRMSHKFLYRFVTYSFSSADFCVLKNSKGGSLQRLSIFEWGEFEKALVGKSTDDESARRGQSGREFGDALCTHQDERKRTQ